MTSDGTVYIRFLLSQAGIAANLLDYLPAGELISLSRTNSQIRADLHDFEEPHPSAEPSSHNVPPELQIGHHETPRWKKLKANALFKCSSPTHTRGTDVKPCRYCSKLICGACMTRASFKNPGEKTFQMRCRSFCESCWIQGNRHKKQKITDDCECHTGDSKGKSAAVTDDDVLSETCGCTNKKDGWVCLECKQLQNKIWTTSICFGEGCQNALEPASDRRKICMWCDKPLPIASTRDTPHVYKQKIVDAIAREAAIRVSEANAYALRRQKRLKMTRRELRGDTGAKSDNLLDFVRDLDTVNYAFILSAPESPTQQQIYASKQGKWQYSQHFLLAFRPYCELVQISPEIRKRTQSESNPGARSNKELFDIKLLEHFNQHRELYQATLESKTLHSRIDKLHNTERESIENIRKAIHLKTGRLFSYDAYTALFWKWTQESQQLKILAKNFTDLEPVSLRPLKKRTNSGEYKEETYSYPADKRNPVLRIIPNVENLSSQKPSLDSAYHPGLEESSVSEGGIRMISLGVKPSSSTTRETTASYFDASHNPGSSATNQPSSSISPQNPANASFPATIETTFDLDAHLAAQESLRHEWEHTLTSDPHETEPRPSTSAAAEEEDDDENNSTDSEQDSEDADLQLALQLSMEEAEMSRSRNQDRNVSGPDGKPPRYFA